MAVLLWTAFYRARYAALRLWLTLTYLAEGYSIDRAQLGAYHLVHGLWKSELAEAEAEAAELEKGGINEHDH